jgi:hypothetical protein
VRLVLGSYKYMLLQLVPSRNLSNYSRSINAQTMSLPRGSLSLSNLYLMSLT